MQKHKNIHGHLLLAASLFCMGWLPSASATPAEPATEGQSSPNRVIVTAGDLRMVLDKMPQGLRIRGLTDTAAGRELLASEAPPLFSATVRDAETNEMLTITADSGWQQADVSQSTNTGGYKLTFAAPTDDRLKGIQVEVTLVTEKAENALTWDLQVANDSPQWGLCRVVFPTVSVRDLGEHGRVFLPVTAGIELSNMWDTPNKRGGTGF